MNVVMLYVEEALNESIRTALERERYSFSATDDPAKLVRLVEQSRKPTIVLTDRPGANPGAIHALLAIWSTPALQQLTRIIGIDAHTEYHRLFGTGLIHVFVALPFDTGSLLGSIEGCKGDLSASGVISQDRAAPCADGACDSLATNYTCKICDVTLCLVHAFPQRDEPGWLCGACFVMPESRQEYWAGIFEAEWWRRWAPIFDDMEPYYTGDGPGSSWNPYELIAGERDSDTEIDGDDEYESEDLLDHLEEDLDGPVINTWALGRAAVDGDYETDDWQEEELERDLYDDDFDIADDGY